jgi:hypothetical protein
MAWGVRDMKVDASSIHLETRLNPSVSSTHRRQALLYYYILFFARRDDFGVRVVGQADSLRPIVNRPGRLRTTTG